MNKSEQVRGRRATRSGSAAKTVPLPELHPDPDGRYQPFPLSDVQQAYLTGRSEGLEPGSSGGHCYFEVDVADWDGERFEAALGRLIERHEMLRAVVRPDGRQQILPQVPAYRVERQDLRGQDPTAVQSRLEGLREAMSHRALPSERWPLWEFRASRLDGRLTRLHGSIDLLIADGRSLEIIFSELTQLYRDPDAALPPLALSFRDYLLAFHSLEASDAFRESRQYWLERVPRLPPSPELPAVANPAAVTRPQYRRRSARIDAAVWRSLKETAVRLNLTPAGVLLAAYAEALTFWSKSPSFLLQLRSFNRLPLHPQANDILGDFTSVDLLEIDNAQGKTFEARARHQQEQLWRDLEHRYFSGIRVMRELKRFQGAGPKAIAPVAFTSLLNLGSGGEETSWLGGLGESVYAITQTPEAYLDCMAQEDRGALVIHWDAVEEMFPSSLLDDLFPAYCSLLEQLAAEDSSWSRTLAENSQKLLPGPQAGMIAQVNDTSAPVSDEFLHSLFLKQVEEHPHAIAVSTPARRMSYAEVYDRACRVEEELLPRGLEPNQLVGIVMEKGWEQVVAVLGVLFAGGAYMPIDPELPAERQRYLIENGDVKVVLTQSAVRERVSVPHEVEVLTVDGLDPVAGRAPVPRTRQKQEDLAYVIYTSGSTGQPKGVMIDHRGAVNTVLDVNHRFGIGPEDRVLALSRLDFDLSVYDIFGMLAAGGTIVMPAAERSQDPAHWAQLLVTENVTVWNTVPALMGLLVGQAEQGEAIGQSLRVIMLSGDWIPVGLPGRIRRLLPKAKIMSLGGATEASIWSILYPIEQVDARWKSIPYGQPMRNQTFHVLNHAQEPCPVWVPGQLYIGGIGLARGYWRDAHKTSGSFIHHATSGARLYRTGDWGRYLPEGNIEFLGREDSQVKMQGYRIELGEIEAKLQEHEAVEHCVVVVREDAGGEKHLVGYVITLGAPVEASALREFLRAKLPEYMVPAAFVFLDQFPLTANGKVDRKALPTQYPADQAESILAQP